MRGAGFLLLGGVLVAGGFAAGWLLRSAPSTDRLSESASKEPGARASVPDGSSSTTPGPRLGSAPSSGPTQRPPGVVAPKGGGSGAPVSAPTSPAKPTALLDADPAYVEQRVRELADGIRRRSQEQFDGADSAARQQVERQIAQERDERDDLLRGGTMAFLKQVQNLRAPPLALLSDPKAFGKLFERKTTAGRIEGDHLRPDTRLDDGDRIVYPAGLFHLDPAPWNSLPSFPRDIVIEGQGMDVTCVVLRTEFQMRGDVHSFTLSDLSIDCGDNYLEALRDGAYTLRVERCRIVGFDMGAGGSCMLGGHNGAFYASESRFEAGFGRNPGSGNLLAVSSGFLARLEDCDIVGPFRSIWYSHSSAGQVFERCRFARVPRDRGQDPAHPPEHVRMVNCTTEFLPEGDHGDRGTQRSLTEINPAWTGSRR